MNEIPRRVKVLIAAIVIVCTLAFVGSAYLIVSSFNQIGNIIQEQGGLGATIGHFIKSVKDNAN